MNFNNYVCFDFETSGLINAYPVEIAAKAYDARSLEPIQGAEFSTLCKPPSDIKIEEEALKVTGIKREDIEKAPLLETVWPKFVEWVNKYNKGKGAWEAPIPCGYNIDSFDLPIASRCNQRFGPKKDKTILFHMNVTHDLMKIIKMWFENSNELTNFKLDTVRNYMGISKDGSHRALKDVEDTGAILMRFLKFHRRLMESGKIGFKNCFSK